MMPLRATHAKLALSALGLAVLTGCASVSLDQNINRVNDEAGSFTGGKLALARTLDERDQRAQAAQALLAQPLEQKDAVQLALVNSPSLQTLLAQGWAESADAAQAGRIANPIFSFERMVAGDELEFGRALSFGLLDLLTLPARHGGATRRIEQAQLRLTSDVVDQITRVRQSWVRAVAAQQALDLRVARDHTLQGRCVDEGFAVHMADATAVLIMLKRLLQPIDDLGVHGPAVFLCRFLDLLF